MLFWVANIPFQTANGKRFVKVSLSFKLRSKSIKPCHKNFILKSDATIGFLKHFRFFEDTLLENVVYKDLLYINSEKSVFTLIYCHKEIVKKISIF